MTHGLTDTRSLVQRVFELKFFSEAPIRFSILRQVLPFTSQIWKQKEDSSFPNFNKRDQGTITHLETLTLESTITSSFPAIISAYFAKSVPTRSCGRASPQPLERPFSSLPFAVLYRLPTFYLARTRWNPPFPPFTVRKRASSSLKTESHERRRKIWSKILK